MGYSIPGSGGVTSLNSRTGPVTLLGSDVPAFNASGAAHAPGSVPDPGAAAGTTRALFEDGSWKVPAGGGGGSLPWLGSLALTPPAPASFTWINQAGNSASSTSQTGQTTFFVTSSTASSFSAMSVTYAGAKRSIVAFLISPLTNGASLSVSPGLYVGDSNGKYLELTLSVTTSGFVVRVLPWTSPTAPGSVLFTSLTIPYQPGLIFLSVYDDATNLNFQVSVDGGQNWDTVYSQARSAYLTNPSIMGFGASFGYTGAIHRINFVHWSLG